MILTYKIDIYETKKSNQGQGQKVKGQGQISNCIKNFGAINHERIIGFWWHDTYTYDQYIQVVVFSEVGAPQSRPEELKCDSISICVLVIGFGYKTWIVGSNLLIGKKTEWC